MDWLTKQHIAEVEHIRRLSKGIIYAGIKELPYFLKTSRRQEFINYAIGNIIFDPQLYELKKSKLYYEGRECFERWWDTTSGGKKIEKNLVDYLRNSRETYEFYRKFLKLKKLKKLRPFLFHAEEVILGELKEPIEKDKNVNEALHLLGTKLILSELIEDEKSKNGEKEKWFGISEKIALEIQKKESKESLRHIQKKFNHTRKKFICDLLKTVSGLSGIVALDKSVDEYFEESLTNCTPHRIRMLRELERLA